MREYTGVIKTVGAGHSANTMRHGLGNVLHTVSYIEIGDEIIKKAKAYSGINGELAAATQHGKPVTLYMQGKFDVGITTPEGRTFASQGDNFFMDVFVFLAFLVLGIFLTMVVIGLPILYFAWLYWQRIAARFAAGSIPGAIMI